MFSVSCLLICLVGFVNVVDMFNFIGGCVCCVKLVVGINIRVIKRVLSIFSVKWFIVSILIFYCGYKLWIEFFMVSKISFINKVIYRCLL